MQIPYQPYPYPQPTYVPQARVLPFDKTWHWIKIGLIVASLIFSIVILGLSIALAVGIDVSYSFSISIIWCAPLVVVTILWDIAELITLFACGKRHGQEGVRQGIHPGAHVGVDLCIWLAGVICALVSGFQSSEAQYMLLNCQEEQNANTSSSSYRYYYYDCDADEYAALQGMLLPVLRAILAFICLLT
jgi:uncharacterized membrane protein YjfL (UPF0719 family)